MRPENSITHLRTGSIAAAPALRAMVSAVLFIAWLLLANSIVAADETSAEKITYQQHARPIFLQRCSSCHNGERKDGDLDVTNYTSLMLGSASGEVIDPGSADDSYLYQLVTHEDSPEMPPSGDRIPDAQIEVLQQWINGGALENSESVAKKRKPKTDYSAVVVGDKRPDVEPVPSRLPLKPQHVAKRPSVVHSIATSPWSAHVAVSSPRQVLVYRTNDFRLRGIIPFSFGQPETIRFSANGSLLLIGGGKPGASGKVLVWDVEKGRPVTVVGDELDSVLAADIHPSQTLVALGGPKKVVRVFGMDGDLKYELKKHTQWITGTRFSPDGKFLVSGDRNGGLHVWDAETGNEVMTLSGHKKAITAIDWRIDGKLLLSASEDGTVRVWDRTNGKQIKSFTACAAGVTSACFTRDGQIVTGGRDRLVRVWNQSGKQIHQYEAMPDQVTSVSWCHETNRPIAGDWSGAVHVWDKANPKPIATLNCNPPAIETRIARLEQKIQTAAANFRPLADEMKQLDDEIASMKSENEADAAARKDFETKLEKVKRSLLAADQSFKSVADRQATWKQELANKQLAVPQIDASLESARSALKSLGDDPDLSETIARLEQRKTNIDQRIGELKSQLQQGSTSQKTTKTQIETFKLRQQSLVEDIAALDSRIANRRQELGDANDRHAALKVKYDQAKSSVDEPTGKLAYWKAELEFANALRQLEDNLASVENDQQAKLDALEKANVKMAEAQVGVDQAKAGLDQSQEKINSIESRIEKLKSTSGQ